MPRDKLAAMASRAATGSAPSPEQGASSSDQSGGAKPSPPRRDKLAALASRNASQEDGVTKPATPPKGRGNKLAVMAAKVASGPNSTPKQNDEEEKKEKALLRIKERLSKRKKILDNLDRAEDLTCKLLEIAHQTTTALQDLNCAPNISELSRSYRQTLRELHPLLSTDTQDLIQPYKNHTTETRQSMYAARVEMRLAKERTEVLKAFTDLEKANASPAEAAGLETESRKRPRDDGSAAP